MNKYNIIAAMCRNRGIGYRGKIPWHDIADMVHFRTQTRDSVVIMGRKTWESLPKPLVGRVNVVLSNTMKNRSDCQVMRSFPRALRKFGGGSKPIFVIGGQQLYEENIPNAHKIILTEIPRLDKCDTFFPPIPGHFRETSSYVLDNLFRVEPCPIVREYENWQANTPNEESKYLDLLNNVLTKGHYKPNRTGISTFSLGNQMLKFSMDYDAFNDRYTLPVMTTKKVFLKGVVNELIWFLNGNKNVKWLQERGVHIWDGNSSPEYMQKVGLGHYPAGSIGPAYGAQWIAWNGDPRLNQFADILHTLKTDPTSRRMVMSAWNYEQLPRMALPPCHVMYIFNVQNGRLNCHLTLRSSDLFLGLPFNITSTALMTILLARAANMAPGEVAMSIVDAHIYETHVDAVREQLERCPLRMPTLSIWPKHQTYDEIKTLAFNDFDFDYFAWPKITAPMAV